MLLFLDIDGVLNKESDWRVPYTLNQECLKIFQECFSGMEIKIILISSWRKGFISPGNPNNTPQICKLEEFFRSMGLRINGTVSHTESDRKKAIESFLKRFSDNYLILDDDLQEYNGQKLSSLYLVNSKTGLAKKDIKAIRKMIKNYT